jgi:hypothetical protein
MAHDAHVAYGTARSASPASVMIDSPDVGLPGEGREVTAEPGEDEDVALADSREPSQYRPR